MARHYRPLTCLMIALLALAGTASASASLMGGLSGSVTTDHGSADLGGNVDANVDGADSTVDADLAASADAQGHSADVFADSDGNVFASADDHEVSANADVEGRSATVTVDGTTVSTDDLDADLPADLDVPDVPHGEASLTGTLSAMASGAGGLMASLAASITALFRW